MQPHHQSSEVRQIVRETLPKLGLDAAALAEISESLLVQEGRYFGRTFVAGEHMAMWLIDVQLIQFYGPDGEMLATIDLSDRQQSPRRAA